MTMVLIDGFDHYGGPEGITASDWSLSFGDAHIGLPGSFDIPEGYFNVEGTFEARFEDPAAVYRLFYGADELSLPPLNRKQRRAEMARAGRKKRNGR